MLNLIKLGYFWFRFYLCVHRILLCLHRSSCISFISQVLSPSSILPPFFPLSRNFPSDASEDIPDQGRRPRASRFVLFQVTSSRTYSDISSNIKYLKSNYNPSQSPFPVPLSTSSSRITSIASLFPSISHPIFINFLPANSSISAIVSFLSSISSEHPNQLFHAFIIIYPRLSILSSLFHIFCII